MMVENDRGSLFIVAAPSGGGKTSLIKALTERMANIRVSISHTTRPARPGEQHGVDYFFVDKQTFARMVEQGEFIEYATVFDHCYGTSVLQIKDDLDAGIDIVLDIDWQGAKQIRSMFKEALSVFVVPPSLDVLKQRLRTRQQDNNQVIDARMQRAQAELSHYREFDYLIVNDVFDKAAAELEAIVTSHRLRTSRQAIRERKLLSFLLSSK